MLKKFLAVLLSAMMLTMSMTVYAAETEHVHEEGCACEAVETVTEVQPRGEICSCGKAMSQRSTRILSYTYQRSCQHGGTGLNDTIAVYKVYYCYVCSSCGIETSLVYSHDTEVLQSCPVA